jgi:uncharacterized membrane protein YbhN (UPF0104 family)
MGAHRKITLTVVSLAITCAALWFVFRQFEWSTFAAQLHTLDWRWIAAAVACDIASYIAQGARWSALLENKASLPITTRAVYTGLFLNEILPMRPGEVVRGWIVARHTSLSIGPIVRSMVAERVIDTVILVAAALLAALFAPIPVRITEYAAAAAAILLIVAIVAARRIPSAWLTPLRNRTALLASSGILLGQCAAVWCTLRACALPLSPLAGIAITVILRIGTAIPLAPANAGTHQVSMLAALALFGSTGPTATGVALIVFATLTLPLLLIGAVSFTTSQVPAKPYLASPPVPHSSSA